MDDLHEEHARKAFRPHSRPLWIAVVANALLFGVLVVFPYVRGHLRAEEARERFAGFAACFWGGAARTSPGLELPPEERERYASNVLHGPRDWPARCRDPLARVAPDEPFLLFPGVKQAEEDVRAAVTLVDGALTELGAERGDGVGAIPHRPHLAVGRLLASLSALHQVAGATEDMRGHAIAFEGETTIAEPARVPLLAALDAVLRMRAAEGGIEATAVDARGISRVRVAGGRVDIRRVPRPSLVRGVVPGPGGPWVTWAMAPARCAAEEHGCAHHATGLAPLPDDATRTPEPRWYAGHPAGRLDRVVHLGEAEILMLAAYPALRVEEPHVELRRFPVGGGDSDGPVAAEWARPLEGVGEEDAILLVTGGADQPPLVVFSVRGDAGIAFRMLAATEASDPVDLTTSPGEGPFAFGCTADTVRWLVLGTETEMRVARLATDADGGTAAVVSAPVTPGVSVAVSPEDPRRDRVRIACDERRSDVLVLREDGALLGVTCDASAQCAGPRRLAQGVAQFDAVRDAGETLVAWAPRAEVAEVHVASFGPEGLGQDVIPTPCWQSEEGFCGAPRLAAENGRFLLAARERTDLLVVESTDGGRRWRPMRGIR